jgi:RND family efflux transporter MFP subunit
MISHLNQSKNNPLSQNFSRSKKFISLLTLSVFVSQIVFASPGHDGGHEAAETVSGAQSQYPVVSVSKSANLLESMPKVEATGKVLPKYTSDIFAARDGIISELRVDLGDSVTKGQIVAVLLPDQSQSQLQAELRVTQTELDLLRQRKAKLESDDSVLPIVSQIKTAGKNLEATQQGNLAESRKLETEIVTANKNLESTLAENLAEINKIEAQVEILSDKTAVQSFSEQNGIRDLLNVIADFLYQNPEFLERSNFAITSGIRRSEFFANDSLAQNETRTLEAKFVELYMQFKAAPEQVDIKTVIALGNQVRSLAARANPQVNAKVEFKSINDRLYETTDHLTEVLNEALSAKAEIKTLEAEKKRLLIANQQRSVVAQNRINSIEASKDLLIANNTQRSVVAKNEIEALQSQQSFNLFELDSQITQKVAEVGGVSQQLGFGAYVRAPFSGIITKRHLNVGDSAGGDKPIYSLVDSSNKFIRFFVTEPQFPFIEKGKVISFAPSSAPSQKYEATIARISPSIDPETQTILVEADLASETDHSKILAHMNVRVEVPVFSDAEEFIVIPEKAVQLSGSPNGVWIVNKAIEAERVEIKVAYIYNGLAFVSAGLTGDEWLITKTPVRLEDGLEIDTKTDF